MFNKLTSSPLLAVLDGNTPLAWWAGDISLNGSGLDASLLPLPTLKARGVGRINLISAAKLPAEVPLDPTSLTAAQLSAAFPAQGQISLQNGAQVDASGAGGGRIVIRGGSLTVDNSTISANTTGGIDGQGIDISVLGDLALSNGGQITSLSTPGLGAGGNINVDAGSLRLDGGGAVDANGYPSTQISTSTGDPIAGAGGPARGGNITLNTGSLEMVNTAQISTASFGHGNGRCSIDQCFFSIRMDALLTTVVQLSANTQEITAVENAGDIVIHTGSLDMHNGATMFAATSGSGKGRCTQNEAYQFFFFATYCSGFAGALEVACLMRRISVPLECGGEEPPRRAPGAHRLHVDIRWVRVQSGRAR